MESPETEIGFVCFKEDHQGISTCKGAARLYSQVRALNKTREKEEALECIQNCDECPLCMEQHAKCSADTKHIVDQIQHDRDKGMKTVVNHRRRWNCYKEYQRNRRRPRLMSCKRQQNRQLLQRSTVIGRANAAKSSVDHFVGACTRRKTALSQRERRHKAKLRHADVYMKESQCLSTPSSSVTEDLDALDTGNRSLGSSLVTQPSEGSQSQECSVKKFCDNGGKTPQSDLEYACLGF